MYKDIAKNIETFNLQIPNTTIPSPTDDDYSKGFIYRYFLQKANDENSFIFEVSENDYISYKNNPFWKNAEIKWRISGPIESVNISITINDKGVIGSNKAAVSLASSVIKNISLYLPNLLQFHRA
jgi:hypothetical protein